MQLLVEKIIQKQSEEFEQDFSEDDQEELIGRLQHLSTRPIDLTACNTNDLLSIPLLDLQTANKICATLSAKPQIESQRELRYVFDEDLTYQLFEALTRFQKAKSRTDRFQWKNQIGFDLQERKGFKSGKYQGNRLYSKQKIFGKTKSGGAFSILLEKDAGESISPAHHRFGFDHLTAFLQMSPNENNKVIFGDFAFKSGAGLLFGSDSFSSPTQGLRASRKLSSLRGKSSSNENRAHRGVAMSSSWKALEINLGLSRRSIDASHDIDLQGNRFITSFGSTGLHRTEGELLRRKSAQRSEVIINFGFEKWVEKKQLALDISGLRGGWSLPWASSLREDLRGIDDSKSFGGTGLALIARWSNTSFNGEWVRSINESSALRTGIKYGGRRLSLSASFRDYSPNFFSPFAGAYDRNGIPANNELGFLYNARFNFMPGTSISLAFDNFETKERTYFHTSPLHVNDLHIHAKIRGLGDTKFRLRFRSRNLSTALRSIEEKLVQTDLRVRKTVTTKLRWTGNLVWKTVKSSKIGNETDDGFLLSTDLAWTSDNCQWSTGFRRFVVDSYNARIFNYETNISDYFYIPAFSGRGYRFFAQMSFNPSPRMRVESKWALWKYSDRDLIGSGNQQIEGSVHSNFRIQSSIIF